MARAIHKLSNRKDAPLIKVNCAAIQPTLIENELFGYENNYMVFGDAKVSVSQFVEILKE